ncbi:hypothetical protein ACFCWG_41130 [Streptomyces sp. NPDC056390]|uniref:hypothetical protein n=1 Tax=Streptomyces sp. NPDC056390 TaxID=3345806 RepID=UPI0035D764A8
MGDEQELMDAAEPLGAAWAQQGVLTLVLRVDGRDRHPGQASWRRSRLTGGSGATFTGKAADSVRETLEANVTGARADFDHTIMVKRQWTDAPSMGISPPADDHLVVTYGHFPRTTRSTTVNAGEKSTPCTSRSSTS